MKCKGIILTVVLVAFILSCGRASAAPTTAHQAQKLVRGWLKAVAHPLGTPLGQQIKKVETYTDAGGQPIYYIVDLQQNGFVIVPADDQIEPIIGFVEEGTYDPSTDNPLGALVTNDLNGRMESVRTGRQSPTKAFLNRSEKHQNKWNKFSGLADMSTQDIGTLGLTSIDDIRVSPLIETKWYQRTCCANLACYNYYTPGPPNGGGAGDPNNYWCGCVATALAQIMYYYQWPNTGIGTHSFVVKIRDANYPRQTRGGDGAGGAYDWADMVLVPGCSTTDVERQAIGALCYDAGVAISNRVSGEYTSYDSDETLAFTHSAKLALINDSNGFKYANAVFGYNGGSNINDLNDMVNSNLDAGLPVCFGIHGSTGGHEVVCDGYGYNGGTPYHHINMGWAGAQNAWYNLPDINSTPSSYNTIYETIYNIYKLGSGEVISGRVTDPCGNPISDVNVNQAYYPGPSVIFTHHTNSKGIYAFYGLNSDANVSIWADKTGYVFPGWTIVKTGHSADSQPTSGNLWGVDIVAIAPDVNSMMPTSGPGGTYMKIQGSHFGAAAGTVIFPGVGYYGDILQWSDTLILCRVPFCPVSGDVVVQSSVGVNSSGVHFDITNPATIYVDANHTPDVENGTTDYPFSTIERGIYATYGSAPAYTVIVEPGTYRENITLSNGMGITLSGSDPNDPNTVASTIIDGNQNGAVVTFDNDCSTLTGLTITDGNSTVDPNIYGGGIYCTGGCEATAPTISHCIITGNSAGYGGGIYCNNSFPTIDNCFIAGNSASWVGGGIDCNSGQDWYYPTIYNCLIVGNSALYAGGGIYVTGGSPAVNHCTISSNSTDPVNGGGGGILCEDSNMMVHHTILWADAAPYGPEILIWSNNNPSTLTAKYSDVQGGSTAVYLAGGSLIWDANSNINADPQFVRDPNPGPDGTWDDVNDDYGNLHLSDVSPCIDSGDPNYVFDLNKTDMDGQPRVVGCRTDIGADEFVYLGDIDFNGDVDFVDFAAFASYWQDTNCGKCSGADLTGDGIADIKDLAVLADNWLNSLCHD
jgi:hypothetical protein